ncbi:MAG: RAMP superfamily CRISPR-associated protein [Candidatus Thorarchaeota archaeon]
MQKLANKKVSSKVKYSNNPRTILKVFCYTTICKPLNGSLPSSNRSYLLKLYPISYAYKNGKEEKKATIETYFIKGLRGAIRHRAMQISQELGIEVCHNSDKKVDKKGNPLIPEGFHPLGFCEKNGGSCLIHQIFGSKGHEGLISIYASPIGSIPHKTAKLAVPIQNVHLATEDRVNISFEGKPIQNFKEKYFSGYFCFEIDVSKCNSVQLGFLIQSVIDLEKLGKGYNSGYGRLEVQEIQLLKREVKKKVEWGKSRFKVKKEVHEESRKHEVLEALQEWENYGTSA